MGITDKGMQASAAAADVWLTESFGRGNGALLGRITPAGARAFYYRYAGSNGQVRLPIGSFNAKGDAAATFTVAQARAKALQWSVLRRDQGIVDLREHFAQADADATLAAAIHRQRLAEEERALFESKLAAGAAKARRLSVRRAFDDWRKADLQPRLRADGKRTGRVDGGQYVCDQFTRHIFPAIGDSALEDVTKADLLALLDAQKAAGKMRTANVLLADLKQMLDFALERELISLNPLATVKKSKVGGPSVERDRALSDQEIRFLVRAVAQARMHPRNATAIWLTLATGVRVGELMGAVWAETLPTEPTLYRVQIDALNALANADGVKLGVVDLTSRTWHLPTTKNQRSHTIHLSDFAISQIQMLRQHREVLIDSNDRELSPWVFPATDNRRPVCVKSFGKQLADRQRAPEERLSNRTKATTALSLPGGRWTAHDLRRTSATLMARLGFSSDTINECLNHIQPDRMARVYIQDRREADQVRAFDALGLRLSELASGGASVSNVAALRRHA